MAGLSHAEVDDILALLLRLNEQGITVILIEHIMRAVMSSRSASSCWSPAGRSPTGARRRSIRNPEVESGLSWRIASSIAGVDAGYGAVRVLHDVSLASRAARPWRCSAPTATARAR